MTNCKRFEGLLTIRASALVSLRQISASSAIVAWLRGTVIQVNLTVASREPSRAVTPRFMALGNAETSILTEIRLAFNIATGGPLLGSNIRCLFIGCTLKAGCHAFRKLEEVPWAGGTRFQAGVRVGSRLALGCKMINN